MHYVYILLNEKDNKFYIGFSSDLKQKFKDHCDGCVDSTKYRRPLKLVYYEAFIDETAARQQELYYKTGQGRRVLNKRLNFLNKQGRVA